jgi:inhibitor of cysteine peptidase
MRCIFVADAAMTTIEVNGQDVVSARVGDDILIRLAENATTGYRWAIQITGTAVVSTGDAYVQPPDAQIGAGGQRVFTVTATAPGAADIVLRLARLWEPNAIEERVVHVTAHDD